MLPVFRLPVSEIRHLPDAPTHVQPFAAGEVIDRHRHDDIS